MDCSNVKSIVLDIEGTISSIAFVKDTLFPYIKDNLKNYLELNWEKDELKKDVEALKEQALKDKEDAVEGFVAIENWDKKSVEQYVEWSMGIDRKTTALKQLQGHIWSAGYTKGQLTGHIYPDVADMLRLWKEGGRELFIYSSGSVGAQKQLLGYSEAGDLLPLIAGHFDTSTGPKTESDSFKKIAKEIGVAPEEILFLTDVVHEAEAANEAGIKVAIVIREGNTPITDDMAKKYYTINSLADLTLESCAKRAKLDNEIETDNKKEATMVMAQKDEPMDTKPVSSSEKINANETEKMEIDGTEENLTDKTVSKEADNENLTEKVANAAAAMDAKNVNLIETVEKTQTQKVENSSPTKNVKDNISTEKVENNIRAGKVENIISDKKEVEISAKKVEDIISDKKVEDDISAKKGEDDISAKKVEDDISAKKVEDNISPEKVETASETVEEPILTEKVEDKISPEKVETASETIEEPISTEIVKENAAAQSDSKTEEVTINLKTDENKTEQTIKTNELVVSAITPEAEEKQDKVPKENGAAVENQNPVETIVLKEELIGKKENGACNDDEDKENTKNGDINGKAVEVTNGTSETKDVEKTTKSIEENSEGLPTIEVAAE